MIHNLLWTSKKSFKCIIGGGQNIDTKLLLESVTTFQDNQDNFINISSSFNSKIKYLSYKLRYPEAETDLIIYLHQLLLKLDLQKFNSDQEILGYIKKCLHNKAIKLAYKINLDKSFVAFDCDNEILDLIDKNNFDDGYSNIFFNDLISSLKPKQKQIMYYKFQLQLSDMEISKILKISRQAVNKSKRLALKNLKFHLCKEGHCV